MASPQQSTIIKESTSQNCNSLMTHVSGEKNLQYKKHLKSEVEVEEDSNFYLDAETLKTNDLCATITSFNLNTKVFSDLIGALPHKSSRGNFYVMVMYDYDSNAIMAEPIKKGRHQPSVMISSRSTRSWKKEAGTWKFTIWTTHVLVA